MINQYEVSELMTALRSLDKDTHAVYIKRAYTELKGLIHKATQPSASLVIVPGWDTVTA